MNNSKNTQAWFYYAASSGDDILKNLHTSPDGLPENEAKDRLKEYGYNETAKKRKRTVLFLILPKFINPLVIVLLIVAGFSFFFGQKISAFLVGLMAASSVLFSFIQEYRAGKEAEKLSEMVHSTATVIRKGKRQEIKIREIVPGDIVDLYAGDMIPADLRIISAKDLFINQSSLTGESLPVEKFAASFKPKNGSIPELTPARREIVPVGA